jgi:hypothetical protein
MSSVTSAIAQRPYRAQNFIVVASGFAYNAASVEGSAPTGVIAGAGSQEIQVNTYANAIATGAAADLLSTTGDLPTTAGMLFRDMGRTVRVFVNGYQVYTLAKVQRMNDASSTSSVAEGVNGDAPSTAGLSGYETYYVCTWSAYPTSVAVTVARVGGQ